MPPPYFSLSESVTSLTVFIRSASSAVNGSLLPPHTFEKLSSADLIVSNILSAAVLSAGDMVTVTAVSSAKVVLCNGCSPQAVNNKTEKHIEKSSTWNFFEEQCRNKNSPPIKSVP